MGVQKNQNVEFELAAYVFPFNLVQIYTKKKFSPLAQLEDPPLEPHFSAQWSILELF